MQTKTAEVFFEDFYASLAADKPAGWVMRG